MPGIKQILRNFFKNEKKIDKSSKMEPLPPMPDKQTLDKKFQEFMYSISMPAQTVEKMEVMSDENKWIMICQQDKKTSKEKTDDWIKTLKKPATESTLIKFKVIITSVDVKWMKSFVEKNGLFLLVSQNLSESTSESDMISCMRAIKSFMNSDFGLKAVIRSPNIFDYFVHPLRSENEEILSLTFDLLAVVSWVDVNGHMIVSELLQKSSKEQKLKTAYSLLVKQISEAKDIQLMVSAITLINVMVNSIHHLEERCHQRRFLLDDGILNAISKSTNDQQTNCKNADDLALLLNQFEIFEKEMENDRKESELLNINMNDPESVWNFLLKSSIESGHSAYLIDLMKYFLIIPNVRRLGHFIWQNCHNALQLATAFIINDKEIDEMEENIDRIDENVDFNAIIQKSFTKDARLLKYSEIKKIMEKKVAQSRSKSPEEIDAVENLRKEFNRYKIDKENEIAELKKSAALTAKPDSEKTGETALPVAAESSAELLPPPLAGAETPLPPPPLDTGAPVAPSIAGIGAPPPLGGIGAPPPLGASAPQKAYLPEKSNPSPSVKMKNLHWGILPVNKIEGTVWDGIKDDNVVLDKDEFEEMFKAKATASLKTGKSGGTKKPFKERVLLIDSKRSTNVEIALSRFKMSPEAIKEAILSMDEKILSAENIGKMLLLVPNKEEAEICSAFDGNVNDLGTTEKFFKVVSTIDDISSRLTVFQFKQQFAENYNELMGEIDKVKRATREIEKNENLKKILSIILKTGNYMNGGTKKGGVYGYKLSTLRQLNSTKSNDNKITLLQYIVYYVSKTNPEYENFVNELSVLEEAKRIECQNLQTKVNKMKLNINKITSMLKKATDDPRDRFKTVMEGFVNDVVKKAAIMHKSMTEAVTESESLIESYSEDKSKMKWEELFKIFDDFVSSYKNGIEFWKKVKQKEDRDKKKKDFAIENKKRLEKIRHKSRDKRISLNNGVTDNVVNNLKQAHSDAITQEILRRRKLSQQ